MSEDAQTHLTGFITDGKDQPEQKTRLLSKEQTAFDLAFKLAGAEKKLDVGFMKNIAENSELLMMSYQGRRSDDVVEMTKGLEQSDVIKAGVQEVVESRRTRRLAQHGNG